jgi:hypothetical protein
LKPMQIKLCKSIQKLKKKKNNWSNLNNYCTCLNCVIIWNAAIWKYIFYPDWVVLPTGLLKRNLKCCKYSQIT